MVNGAVFTEELLGEAFELVRAELVILFDNLVDVNLVSGFRV